MESEYHGNTGLTHREYDALHTWIRYHHGPATKCENPDCKGKSKKYSWAKRPECGYERDIANFQQLCWSCHIGQDIDKKNHRDVAPQLEFRGEKKSLAEWSELLGLDKQALRQRINYLGWTVERALSTPIRPKKKEVLAKRGI